MNVTLDSQQLRIAGAPAEACVVVIGDAGTGKTVALDARLQRIRESHPSEDALRLSDRDDFARFALLWLPLGVRIVDDVEAESAFARACERGKPIALASRECEWLVDDDMLSGAQRRRRERSVGRVGCRDNDELDGCVRSDAHRVADLDHRKLRAYDVRPARGNVREPKTGRRGDQRRVKSLAGKSESEKSDRDVLVEYGTHRHFSVAV